MKAASKERVSSRNFQLKRLFVCIENAGFFILEFRSRNKPNIPFNHLGARFLFTNISLEFKLKTFHPVGKQDKQQGKYRRAWTANVEEWAKFLHTKNKLYTDFAEVRKEIQLETDDRHEQADLSRADHTQDLS